MEQDGADTAAPQDAAKSLSDAGRAADGCGQAGNVAMWNFSCHLTFKSSSSSNLSLEHMTFKELLHSFTRMDWQVCVQLLFYPYI